MELILRRWVEKPRNSTRNYSMTVTAQEAAEEVIAIPDCQCMDPTDITRPVFKINAQPRSVRWYNGNEIVQGTFDLWAKAPRYNYIFTSAFGRYYFVERVVYDHAFIYYHCICDVMGTSRPHILSRSLYVTRSASSANSNIPDSKYPLTAQRTTATQIISTSSASGWIAMTGSNGYYICGVIGADGVHYYIMQPAVWKEFYQKLCSDAFVAQMVTALALDSYPELKMIVDPLQYITSCIWMPAATGIGVNPTQRIPVGFSTIGLSNYAYSLDGVDSLGGSQWFITKQTHPQAAARGVWVYGAGPTDCYIKLAPFGVFNLDAMKIQQANNTLVELKWDMITGGATLTVSCLDANGNPTAVLVRSSAQLGVSIPLTQVKVQGVSPVRTAENALGFIGDILTGNVGGAISGIADAGYDLAASQVPKVSIAGTQGGNNENSGVNGVFWNFNSFADASVSDHGRPLCGTYTLSALSGYTICDVDDLTGLPACTNDERKMILDYLNSGFYIV